MKNGKEQKVGEEIYNYQNCLMKIIEYNNAHDIIVEFQDNYKVKVHTAYCNFKNGNVKNPYFPSVYGVGIIGNKYPLKTNNRQLKEYKMWQRMLERCFDKKFKEKHPTYKDVTCCDEWLLYENFYDWVHSQENFNKWYNNYSWSLDKDIIKKGNKVYSYNTCCLVPKNVNNLFTKNDVKRGSLPIGVCSDKNNDKYKTYVRINGKQIMKICDTLEEAFQTYKQYKESYIKQVAQDEYDKENITKQCYDAMMNYEVEITD